MLRLAQNQSKALQGACSPLEKKSFLLAAYLLLDRLHKSWLEEQLRSEALSVDEFLQHAADDSYVDRCELPQSLHLLKAVTWYDDFLSHCTQLNNPETYLPASVASRPTLIASVGHSKELSDRGLQEAISGFEAYFDALLGLSEEY